MAGICRLCDNGYWAVNGQPIYVPSSISVSHDNITAPETGRTESGKMHIVWVRRRVTKIELTFDMLTGEAVDFMSNLMQGQEFKFTYYDHGVKELDVYCGRDSYTQHDLSQYKDEGGVYKDFKINVEEM